MPNSEWMLTPAEWSLVGLKVIAGQKGVVTTDTVHKIQEATANAQAVNLLQYLIAHPPSFVYGADNMSYENYLQVMLKQIQGEGK